MRTWTRSASTSSLRSSGQQVAQEWQDKQQGAFTYYLIEGLKGAAAEPGGSKRWMTVDSLSKHVLARLKDWSWVHGGPPQQPTSRVEGSGDIILAEHDP